MRGVSLSRTVYWTGSGKSYHFDQDCSHLARAKTIYTGTLAEARDSGILDPCAACTAASPVSSCPSVFLRHARLRPAVVLM